MEDPDLPGAWAKIPALLKYLPRYDWIWCTDIDLIITNRLLSIEEHALRGVPADKHIVAAQDCFAINMGSFFIRNSRPALRFLAAVHAMRRNASIPNYDVWYENAAVVQLVHDNVDGAAELFHLVPQRYFNAYYSPSTHLYGSEPPDCGDRFWQVGDFALHFPGQADKTEAWASVLEEGGEELRQLLP
ncbi:hypothetical protein GPECTOR_1g888 [Gonium pectorale]|uniref:Nucleotide-diphospho-sugar transferase domain-containing protein n=1 Tax=Gonium pectorale TaxID=33097 RepID=A0A150H4J9_GONPE|nr:hypothetical protein GPECTOR_1g888 [Gonium pectorale]|eukprot:KXZ56983.1 hypothetical protein GPECTOR_1g888 [Gonium pectorale]